MSKSKYVLPIDNKNYKLLLQFAYENFGFWRQQYTRLLGMKAYLIPGNGEDLNSREYKAVLNMYKKLGYEPVFVDIDWKYKTIDDWVEQVKAKIPEKELANSLLSGFSFGSMIALAVAAQVNPKKLLLFSLSPYFKEDIPFPEKYLKWHGKRRMEKFKIFSLNELTAEVHCPTIVFLGSKEKEKYPDMWKRTDSARKKIRGSKLSLVKDAGHDVGDPKYVQAIKTALNT